MSSWSRAPAPWPSGRGCSSTTSNCGATPGYRCCRSCCSCGSGSTASVSTPTRNTSGSSGSSASSTPVGLPALDGEAYATGENLLGVALSALMRLPADRRAELYAAGLKRIAGSAENDYRRFLLAECLEAYAELDDVQKERLQALLHAEPYQEVEPLMKTTYERG